MEGHAVRAACSSSFAFIPAQIRRQMSRRFGPFTRREFLRNSGLVAAGVAGGVQMQNHKGRIAPATRPLFNYDSLTPFVDPLPVPALIKPKGARPSPEEP